MVGIAIAAACIFGPSATNKYREITRPLQSARRARPPPAPAPCRPLPGARCPGCRPRATLFLPRQRRPRVYACLHHHRPAQTTKAPGISPRPLPLARNSRLFQRAVDRGELAVQVAAEAVDHSDNRKRNAGGNQAVFDGGGTGLVLHKTRNQILHE